MILQKALRVYPLTLLDHIEPFNTSATTPAHSDCSSQPLDLGEAVASPNPPQRNRSGPGQTVQSYESGGLVRPRVGKVALVAVQSQDVQEPTQCQDSGTGFNKNVEPDSEIPPTYIAI